MSGPALCPASRKAAVGASQCSSGITLLPIGHRICSHSPPPSASSLSVQAVLSLVTRGPCRALTHTLSLCFGQTGPVTRPCPGAASAPPWAARAALAQNGFSSDKESLAGRYTAPAILDQHGYVPTGVPDTTATTDPALPVLCGEEGEGSAPVGKPR